MMNKKPQKNDKPPAHMLDVFQQPTVGTDMQDAEWPTEEDIAADIATDRAIQTVLAKHYDSVFPDGLPVDIRKGHTNEGPASKRR